MDTPQAILYEHATGYALFHVNEFEDIGNTLPQVEAGLLDRGKFLSLVKLTAFSPFQNAAHALENCNAVSEGILHEDLLNFLETNLPKQKKAKTLLGVSDSKIGTSIIDRLPYVKCLFVGIVPEILRGIRAHFPSVAQGLNDTNQSKAQLGLGHSYSRAKVKFNVHRVDNMIIQSIALLDQMDKDINTFSMRIREWYSYHFPELYKIIPDQYLYCRCAKFIQDRKTLTPEKVAELSALIMDETKAEEIFDASRSSMGMDISPIDLINIERFSDRVISLGDYKKALQDYLKDRMHSCAPSLAALIGEQVGARLISKAGSLTNLAKCPASTIQILGAEKALFRALKTRGATPKYGLLFHSTFIGRAAAKNKGRISRYLANKCAMASRIDCFSDVPVETFGEHMRQQVEDRLKFYDSGVKPAKNIDVMHQAMAAATEQVAKVVKKQKKLLKKDKKSKGLEADLNVKNEIVSGGEEKIEQKKSKKKKRQHPDDEPTVQEENNNVEMAEDLAPVADDGESKSKKKKKDMSEINAAEVAEDGNHVVEKPKKKKKKRADDE